MMHFILCGVWAALLLFGEGAAATFADGEEDYLRDLSDGIKGGGKGKERNSLYDKDGRPGGLMRPMSPTTTTKSRAHQNQCARMMADHMPAMNLESLTATPSSGKVKPSNTRGKPGTSAARMADGSLVSETGSTSSGPAAMCNNTSLSAQTVNGAYPCKEVDLMSFIAMKDLNAAYGSLDDNANDMWGWTDPASGREFALVGTYQGTAFVEITNPLSPVVKGVLPNYNNNGGPTGSAWGDVKTYLNYAYIVSEAEIQGLQIFDLTRLLTPDTTKNQLFTENAHFGGFEYAHNIVINEATATAYVVGSNMCGGGLYMLNLQPNPLAPAPYPCVTKSNGQLYGYVNGTTADYSYTHDAHCVIYQGPDSSIPQGSELCFACNEDRVTIFDVTVKTNVKVLSEFQYMAPDKQTYTHQGWLTKDHKYFLFGDELDEFLSGGTITTSTYILDVSTIANPILTGTHRGTGFSIDHNMYVKGDYVYQANYRSGFQVYHLTNLAQGQLTLKGSFDIFPRNDAARFNGAWSVYPFFNSGMVALSGIEQGLYVFNPNIPQEPGTGGDDGPTQWVLLNNSEFESNSWGIWIDGGANALPKTLEGDGAIALQGNTSSSNMKTGNINVNSSRKLKVKFSFYPREMTDGDKVKLLLSTGTSGTFNTVKTWARGNEFRNHKRYVIEQEVAFPSPNPSSAALQFKFEGSTLQDSVSIFDVAIYGLQLVI